MNILPTGATPKASARQVDRRNAGMTFNVNETRMAAPSGTVRPLELDGLLSLQEVESAPERDRRARKHAEAILDSLVELQRSLLEGAPTAEKLTHLASLVRQVPIAASPTLHAAVMAVSLRAHVEIARADSSSSI